MIEKLTHLANNYLPFRTSEKLRRDTCFLPSVRLSTDANTGRKLCFISISSLIFTSFVGSQPSQSNFYCIIRQLVNSCLFKEQHLGEMNTQGMMVLLVRKLQERSRHSYTLNGSCISHSLTTCCIKHLIVNKAQFHISAKCLIKLNRRFQ